MLIARDRRVLLGVLFAAACGGMSESDAASAPTTSNRAAGPTAQAPSTGFVGTAGATATASTAKPSAPVVETLPPERELTVDLQQPQASEHYVYAVNPNAGTVAVIDAQTQAIKTIKTGSRPSYLRTLDGTDHAIVLNTGSSKASLIRMRSEGPVKTDLPVNPGANAIAVAPDGKHAVVYYNPSYVSAGATSGSYQDVAVLSLSADGDKDEAISMTVGFQPRDVFFDSAATHAYIVTEDGVSVLDFADISKRGSGIAKLVTFGGSVDQKNLDVAITPDGRFALARTEGMSTLHLVDLETGSARTLDLSAVAAVTDGAQAVADADAGVGVSPVAVTDLDLTSNGRAALAVLRNQSAIVKLALPEAFDDPNQVHVIRLGSEIVGSVTVSPDGSTALGYTTATDIERLVIVDLTERAAPRTVLLRKGIQAVAFTPDSRTALITHTKRPGDPAQPGISTDEQIDRSFGYSLLRVGTGDVKLQRTATQLGPAAMIPDASYVFILFRDDAARISEVQRVALSSFLVDPIIQLENPPISIGVAKASRVVFVNLEHADGRMTFIDWDDPIDKLKTVTGFELNSRIRN
jgi:YVTN family beta-propeller protein